MKSPIHTAKARVITIGGGKGGVGKSIVSANLSVAMAQKGLRVVLVDCDLGAANQHVLFGIDRPNNGLQALIDHKIESLAEARTPTSVPNLHLVAGTGASVGAANISHAEKQRIMKKIRSLDADVVIVDVGAGVSFNVLDFFELGSQRLLVVTPQVTSIQTAYSFLKGAVLRTLRHHAEKMDELELLEPAISSKENEKVSVMLARLRETHPEFGAAVFNILSRFGAQIVGNQVFEPNQTGIFHAVSRMIQDFLGIQVPILGYIGVSRRIRESVNQRRPMMTGGARDENAKVFQQMAETLLLEDETLDELLIEEDETPDAADAKANTPASPPPEPTGTLDPEGYSRKHFRHAVDWTASLRTKTAVNAVHVYEVSSSALAVEGTTRLDLGERLVITFDELPQRPSASVVVAKQIPKGYVLEGEIPPSIIFAATTGLPANNRMAG